jgi:hypothetical protein
MLHFAWGIGLWLLLALPVHAQAGEAPPGRGDLPATAHRYELTASLDPAKKQVQGAARITFTNTSQRPLEALLFHLYLNAFRDDDSVFMRESGGRLRGQRARGWGRIELQSLTIAGHDALARAERELVPKDFTQLRVPLQAPLEPGATLVVELRFVATLPPVFARSGYAGDFFAVGQWFPKLAKLDADGFVSFPYHALGEFYADFADYTLEVDAPRDFALVASGNLIDEAPHGGRTRHRYRADCVHDVAFVAGRGMRVDLESVDGVLVRYLSPPGYDAALAQHAEVVRAGLRRFGERFGKYPYGTLSVVVPPRNAIGAAGMEYPTLITTGGSWLPLPGLPALGGAVITAHELAHQWFYGLLASDELHHPVLDEGLTEWASLDLMRTLYGAHEGVGPLAFDRFEIERALAVRPSAISPGLAAYEYESSGYASSVYARASTALESIRRAHGVARFERALSLYTKRHRFQHPTPDDLAAAFDAIYGDGFAARVVRPLLFAGQSSELRVTGVDSRFDRDDYLTHVLARRSGVALPTWLALYGSDGRELARAPWASSSDELRLDLHTHAKVARVVLDPDRALLLDADSADQTVELAPAPSNTLLQQLLAASQLLLAWLGP